MHRVETFKTHWQATLGDESGVSNPIVTQHGVFFGTQGQVFRLDPQTGRTKAVKVVVPETKHTNDSFNREIRLSLSSGSGPKDSDLLMVGVAGGHVLALDPLDLSTRWSYTLPTQYSQRRIKNTSDNQKIVSVLCDDDDDDSDDNDEIHPRIYAAASGYVHRLEEPQREHGCGLSGVAGVVVHTTRLSRHSRDEDKGEDDSATEVRLAMTRSKPVLLAGTAFGVAYGLDPVTIKVRWFLRLDKPGLGKLFLPASVVGGGGLGDGSTYAATDDGYVYRLGEYDGRVLGRVCLRDVTMGSSGKVRVALLAGSGNILRVYIGVNGHAVCLELVLILLRSGFGDGLRIVYSTSLPGSGYSVTDVVVGDGLEEGGTAYFTNDGCVFQLDSEGAVLRRSKLRGFGGKETCLAVGTVAGSAGDGAGGRRSSLVVVGIDGHGVGLGIANMGSQSRGDLSRDVCEGVADAVSPSV